MTVTPDDDLNDHASTGLSRLGGSDASAAAAPRGRGAAAVTRPEHVLLHAVRVLHEQGAHRIQVVPYFYATGHWRCSLLLDGQPLDALKYTNGMGWRLPGSETAAIVDAEREADAIWATLTREQRAAAERPDPAYAAWFAELLDACGDSVPALWDDYENYLREGHVWIGSDATFALPPGDSLRAYL